MLRGDERDDAHETVKLFSTLSTQQFYQLLCVRFEQIRW